jgi:hypothetical protein
VRVRAAVHVLQRRHHERQDLRHRDVCIDRPASLRHVHGLPSSRAGVPVAAAAIVVGFVRRFCGGFGISGRT